jgi:DNA-binding IclR family transcriptional regulator
MTSSDDLASFIASSFRSVWALELLLLLKGHARACSAEELVDLMCASPSVVESALDSLTAAGVVGTDAQGTAYMPASAEVARLVEETEQFYRSKPNRVRRLIVASANSSLAAFSDAFRLKD